VSLAPLLARLGPILEVALGIGIIIIVHELGHLIAAKLSGVRVERFSVGFGPRLFGVKVGETDYRVSLFPWGGYVALSGERPTDAADDPRALFRQPPRKRAFVFVSGVTMNFIFGIIFFILAFRIGVSFGHPTVGGVRPASPAWKAGIEQDDVILEINGKRGVDFEEISIITALSEPGAPLRLKVKRGQEIHYVNVIPEMSPEMGMPAIGIEPKASLVVGRLLSLNGVAPAKEAGIREDDQILAVDGAKVSSWSQFQKEIAQRPNQPTTITVSRENKPLNFQVIPIPEPRWIIGVELDFSAQIEAVKGNSLAQKIGFEAGQKIVAVDAKSIATLRGFFEALEESEGEIIITVESQDEKKDIQFLSSSQNTEALKSSIATKSQPVIAEVRPHYPAQIAGLAPGDSIIEVDTKEIEDAESLIGAIQNSGGEALELTYQRGNEAGKALIEPVLTTVGQPGMIGVLPKALPLVRHYGWLKSIQTGFSKTRTVVIQIYLSIRAMISRRISARQQLGGPITIAVASYYFASEGVAKLLYFLGIISISLVLINLLPLPVLDGGLLFLLGVEKLKGSPVSQKTQEALNYIGWALIISLMLWVTFFDIMRLKDWLDKGLF